MRRGCRHADKKRVQSKEKEEEKERSGKQIRVQIKDKEEEKAMRRGCRPAD